MVKAFEPRKENMEYVSFSFKRSLEQIRQTSTIVTDYSKLPIFNDYYFFKIEYTESMGSSETIEILY